MGSMSLNERRKKLMAEYGWTFVTISFCIFIIEMLVLVVLIDLLHISPQSLADKLGLDVEIPASSGTWAMAYIITRPLKIVQLPLAAAITPPVAKAWRNWRANKALLQGPPASNIEPISENSDVSETQQEQ